MKPISLILFIICLIGCFGQNPENTGLEGKSLPDFKLLLPDSTTYFNTSSISPGKPIVLFYFSPYCPYCRAQTKEIIEDIDKLKDIQFYFITSFPFTAMKNYYEKYQLGKYPNITIGLDSSHFVSDYFEMAGVPYLAIYGKDKKLNKAFMGKLFSSQLKKIAVE